MNEDLFFRLRRLYAAFGETIEDDMTKLRAQVFVSEKAVLIQQDFTGGLSDEQLANTLHSLIALIAGLEYHLRRWAAHNGKNPDEVAAGFRSSRSLTILHDLWNSEKHGYPLPSGRDRSGSAPRLINVTRVMQLKTQAKKGSFVALTVGRDGVPVIHGDGTAQAVVTGDVVSKDGARLGDVHEFLENAIAECEQMLTSLGIAYR